MNATASGRWQSARPSLLLFLAYAALLIALSTDLVLQVDKPLLAEGPPDFGMLPVARTLLIAAASGLFVAGIGRWGGGQQPANADARPDKDPVDPGRQAPAGSLLVWGSILLSLGFLGLYLYDPVLFHRLGSEDRPVENLSALLGFAASAVFLRAGLLFYRSRSKYSRITAAVSILFSGAFFLLAMEEISWFSRFLGPGTPDILRSHPREEFNLHNFATDEIENIYYFGAFTLLVLIPFLNGRTTIFRRLPHASAFIPAPGLALIGALAVAYNYDMWNIVFTQVTFFVTLFILIHYAVGSGLRKNVSAVWIGAALTLVLGQAAFLAFGDQSVRLWDVTEYKEFFIPLGFLVYSAGVLQRARKTAALQAATRPARRIRVRTA